MADLGYSDRLANLADVHYPHTTTWVAIEKKDLPTAAIFEAWRTAFETLVGNNPACYDSADERRFLSNAAADTNFRILGAVGGQMDEDDKAPEDYLLLCACEQPETRYHLIGVWTPGGEESISCCWVGVKGVSLSHIANRMAGSTDPTSTNYGEVNRGYISLLESLYSPDEVAEILLKAL